MASKTTDRPTTSGAHGLGPTGAKDIYLLMRPELIRATLKGQKWQTRRKMRHQPEIVHGDLWVQKSRGEGFWHWHNAMPQILAECPYGKPGDLAVVREGHTFGDCAFGDSPWVEVGYRADGDDGSLHKCHCTEEQAEEAWDWVEDKEACGDGGMNWRSPLHMPRWAARIVRPITEIKVERVADISEADAIAEGLTRLSKDGGQTYKWGIPDRDGLPGNDDEGWHWKQWKTDPRQAYRALWNEINAKPKPRYGREGGKKVITHYEAFPWSEEDFDALYPGAREAGTWKGKPLTVCPNPFVWCISFERR